MDGPVQLQWMIHYDIAALAFVAVLLLFITRSRSVPLRQNSLFSLLTYGMLTATLLDIVTAFTLSYAKVVPLGLNVVMIILCLCSTQTMPILLLIYLFAALRILDHRTKRWLLLYCLPSAPAFMLIVLSPITQSVFYFDEQMRYVHGPLWSALFLPCLFVMGVSVYYIVRHRRRLNTVQIISLLSFDFMIGLGMILQVLFFEWGLLTYFCVSLSLFIIYLAFQRQEYYLNKSADMFNLEAFRDVYEETRRLKGDFGVALLEIPEIRRYSSVYGQGLTAQLHRRINAALSAQFGRDNVFMLSPTRFAALFRPPVQERLARCAEEIQNGWIIERKRISLPCAATTLTEGENMPSPEELDMFLEMAALTLRENESGEIMDLSAGACQRLNRLMDVRRALQSAIEHKTLNAYYQPIYDAKTRKICLVEALARIEDERLGVVPAGEFIDIAERDGSIVNMTALLFDRVCDAAQSLGDRFPGLTHFSFNLSAAQLLQTDLVDRLLRAAREQDVPFTRFIFELTESEPITRSGQVGHNIDRLYAYGANLSLDDFGTGYSNFSNIFTISFDTVKFDKSLVDAYARGGSGFLRHLCDLFHDAGVRVIAEGIETQKQADELTSIGCDMLQGYYFSRPVSKEKLIALLEQEQKTP